MDNDKPVMDHNDDWLIEWFDRATEIELWAELDGSYDAAVEMMGDALTDDEREFM